MSLQHSLSPLIRPHRRLRTVLIGTSLGPESDQVALAGLAVARAAGARVLLVHASQPAAAGFEIGAGPELEREQVARSREELRGQVERLGLGGSELAGYCATAGAPHRILMETALRTGADLIVVGATGAGPLAAELLGSTADRVLRKAHCPVLVVRDGLRVPPRKVLACVDLSTLAGDAFHCGINLLSQIAGADAEVRALHVVDLLDSFALRQKTGQSVEQIERSAASQLRRFLLENRTDAPFRIETAVVPGEPRTEILRALADEPVDLVLLGTHGRGGPDRLVMGSVASTVARKAPCSVLAISPEAALEEGIAEAIVTATAPSWSQAPSVS